MSGYTPNKRSGPEASMTSLTNLWPVKNQQRGNKNLIRISKEVWDLRLISY